MTEYRYRAWANISTCEVEIEVHEVLRKTPKGVVINERLYGTPKERLIIESVWRRRREDTPTRRRYAWPTEAEAIVSLEARTRKRIQHLEKELALCKAEMPIAEAEMQRRGLTRYEPEEE